MKESTTYQAILAEGSRTEAKKILLHLGTSKFGAPNRYFEGCLLALDDLDLIETLIARIVPACGICATSRATPAAAP